MKTTLSFKNKEGSENFYFEMYKISKEKMRLTITDKWDDESISLVLNKDMLVKLVQELNSQIKLL